MTSIRKSNEDFCGSLPLHLINHIQDYGALIVLDKDETVIQISNNCNKLFGRGPDEMLGQLLSGFLTESTYARVHTLLTPRKQSRRIALLSFRDNPELYPAIIHAGSDFHIIEVELAPAGQKTFISVYEEVKDAMINIQDSDSVQEVCDTALMELKAFSNFDRLLIYRFDEEWNGTVIAQVREDTMPDYLGLRFPASDVPRQARALYQTNPYRLIPDRDYTPVRLHPVINPLTSAFTDLSYCNLRSVAGVHIEYMRNMETRASMSTRILVDGRLWGLISCHHREAKLLSYEQSSVFELISDVVASRIGMLETAAKSAEQIAMQHRLSSFIERLYTGNDLAEALQESDLMSVFNASGLIYTNSYHITHLGDVPDEKSIRDLLFWLDTRHSEEIFASRSLNLEFDEWKSYDGNICGMLSIPIRSDQQQYLIILRGEVLEDVSWGGNPAEALQMEPDGKAYHPRNSFHLYKESISGHSASWTPAEIQSAGNLRQAITEYLLRKS
jgi:light-regulated signal transduction histidine kinase (bacteriophytochrome)